MYVFCIFFSFFFCFFLFIFHFMNSFFNAFCEKETSDSNNLRLGMLQIISLNSLEQTIKKKDSFYDLFPIFYMERNRILIFSFKRRYAFQNKE